MIFRGFVKFRGTLLIKDKEFFVNSKHGILTAEDPRSKRGGHLLFDHSYFTDSAILTIRDQKFNISKSYLSLHSPYFYDLFYGPNSTKEMQTFELDCDPDVFADLLDFIYPCFKKTDCCLACSTSLEKRLNLAIQLKMRFAAQRLREGENFAFETSPVSANFPDSTTLVVKGVPVLVSASTLALHSKFLGELLYKKGQLAKRVTIDFISHESFLIFLQCTIGEFPPEFSGEFLDNLVVLGAKGIYDFYMPESRMKLLSLSSKGSPQAATYAMDMLEHYANKPIMDMNVMTSLACFLCQAELELVFSRCPFFSPALKKMLRNLVNSVHSIQIFVKLATAKTNIFNLRKGALTTVLELKMMIRHRVGSPENQQRLIFAGAQLEDERTLEFYKIQKESTLHLVYRLRGC